MRKGESGGGAFNSATELSFSRLPSAFALRRLLLMATVTKHATTQGSAYALAMVAVAMLLTLAAATEDMARAAAAAAEAKKAVERALQDDLPKYALSFRFRGEGEGADADVLGLPSFPLVHEDGTRYECFIPSPAPPQDPAAAAAHAAPHKKELIAEMRKLLQPLTRLRLRLLTGGWWNYEYVRGSWVLQYHEDAATQKMTAKHYLAKAPSSLSPLEDDDDSSDSGGEEDGDGAMKAVAASLVPGKYYEEELGGGSECDITGEPRKCTVRFECNPSAPSTEIARIASVEEVSSCNYLMTVRSPLVCQHPAFQSVVAAAQAEAQSKAPEIICLTDWPEGLEPQQCAITEGEALANPFEDSDYVEDEDAAKEEKMVEQAFSVAQRLLQTLKVYISNKQQHID